MEAPEFHRSPNSHVAMQLLKVTCPGRLVGREEKEGKDIWFTLTYMYMVLI